MYQIDFGNKFLASAKKLDKRVKPMLKTSLDILAKNPFYPKLHTKPLTGKLSDYYSFRLGRNYRVVFKFVSTNTIYLVRVGHRKDIYR